MKKTFHMPQFGKCHVVAINDDRDQQVVTFRYWLRRRQSWIYKAERLWILREWYNVKI